MIDLRRVGDEQHVDLPSDDGVEDLPKRNHVLRQCPLVNRDWRNLRAALPQCSKEIRIRYPVFLYCNSDFDGRASPIEDLQMSRQVLGSGTVMDGVSPSSFSAATGFGPRATTVVRAMAVLRTQAGTESGESQPLFWCRLQSRG